MKTEIDNNGRPTIEADLRDAQAEIRRLEAVNRELLDFGQRIFQEIISRPQKRKERKERTRKETK